MIPKHLAAPLPLEGNRFGRGPMVISDSMAPIQSMLDGQMYDSKGRYYQHVRSRDHEIVGNDTAALTKEEPLQPVGRGLDAALAKTGEQLFGV